MTIECKTCRYRAVSLIDAPCKDCYIIHNDCSIVKYQPMQIKPEEGEIWMKKQNHVDISEKTIFCKILHITEHLVFIIQADHFGFNALPPATVPIEQFLELYRQTD